MKEIFNFYKNLTLEQITHHLNSLIKERDADVKVIPDIIIKEDGNLFWASINGGNIKLNTGIGGLRLFFNNLSDIDFMKVEYNEKILNLEERRLFFNKIKYEK